MTGTPLPGPTALRTWPLPAVRTTSASAQRAARTGPQLDLLASLDRTTLDMRDE